MAGRIGPGRGEGDGLGLCGRALSLLPDAGEGRAFPETHQIASTSDRHIHEGARTFFCDEQEIVSLGYGGKKAFRPP